MLCSSCARAGWGAVACWGDLMAGATCAHQVFSSALGCTALQQGWPAGSTLCPGQPGCCGNLRSPAPCT